MNRADRADVATTGESPGSEPRAVLDDAGLRLFQALCADRGRPRQVRALDSSPRSRVWLVETADSAYVVKQIVGDPDAARRFARELTALRLAERVEPPVVARVLASDATENAMVLEHLVERRMATDWPVAYAAGLARLHAAGRQAEPAALPPWAGPRADDVGAFLALAGALRVPVPASVGAVLGDVVDRLASAPGRCLLHGDPCPDNALHTASGVRFIDLEQAAIGNGLVELAYLRMAFPTCWCVTSASPAVLQRAEQTYRSVWQESTGEDVSGDLADACVGWLLRGDALVPRAQRGGADYLARLVDADWEWGTVTARERLAHRLGVVTDLTVGHPEFGPLGAIVMAMREAMLRRWPGLRRPPETVPAW